MSPTGSLAWDRARTSTSSQQHAQKSPRVSVMACLGTHDYGGVRALSLGTGQRVYGPNTQYWHIHPERGAQSQCLFWGHFGSRVGHPLAFHGASVFLG